MGEPKTSSGGIGVTGLLQVALIVLKLCKVIDWSWWWVLAPSWITVALVLLIVAGMIVAGLIKTRNNNIEKETEKNGN